MASQDTNTSIVPQSASSAVPNVAVQGFESLETEMLDPVEEIDFLLEEIESRIAPLALAW